ncbi:MAG TPA: zf-TFIIB domain-containing protein [Acidobacteriota bacterium]|nr:zf-TFIIB domain-containing protein [Acidobacteriota bacterium]
MKHCPWCGNEASDGRPVEGVAAKCPRCNLDFLRVKVSKKTVSECPSCGGLWVENDTLREICTNREQQQAVMGFEPELTRPGTARTPRCERMYIPCPECKKLMNRQQFAGCSGVIVDWCKTHGTWFDRNELKQIVEFILAGGLSKSRERERIKLEEERQSIKEEQRNLMRIARLGRDPTPASTQTNHDADLLSLLGGIWQTLQH